MPHFLGLGRGPSALSQGYHEPSTLEGDNQTKQGSQQGLLSGTRRALGVGSGGDAAGTLVGSGWEQAPCGN